MDFGIGTVVAITVIVYLIGAGCKAVEGLNNKFIPVICGFSGAVLGGNADYAGLPGKGYFKCGSYWNCKRTCLYRS